MNASYEEKSAWITLVCMVVVFGGYFAVAASMLAAGVTKAIAFIPVFAVTVAGLVAALVIGHVTAAILGRRGGLDPADERDRVISWRAEHRSSWLLAVGVLAAVFGLALEVGSAWIANGLLMALFVAESLNYTLRVYYYRRGV